LASHLRAYGFQAESYHAGKDRVDREMTQSKFINGSLRIIVATIAFGLGVNKSDVRGVIHFNLPKSIENYTQVRNQNYHNIIILFFVIITYLTNIILKKFIGNRKIWKRW